jgi:hypothetical protein
VSNDLGHLDLDSHRKARFRETARAIVAKDRADRNAGRAVDTAAAISRAMERAYKLGQANVSAASQRAVLPEGLDDPNKAIDWELIPPRPRQAFWRICLAILGDKDCPARPGYFEPARTERETPGWQLTEQGQVRPGDVIGEKSILPLIRLGLLNVDSGAGHDDRRLTVTQQGRATWQVFHDRGGRFAEDLTRRRF